MMGSSNIGGGARGAYTAEFKDISLQSYQNNWASPHPIM